MIHGSIELQGIDAMTEMEGGGLRLQRTPDSLRVLRDVALSGDGEAALHVDFAKVVELQPADDAAALWAWHAKVSSRPSAKA